MLWPDKNAAPLRLRRNDCRGYGYFASRPEREAVFNRRGIVFHENNPRLNISIATLQKPRQLGWEVLR